MNELSTDAFVINFILSMIAGCVLIFFVIIFYDIGETWLNNKYRRR